MKQICSAMRMNTLIFIHLSYLFFLLLDHVLTRWVGFVKLDDSQVEEAEIKVET